MMVDSLRASQNEEDSYQELCQTFIKSPTFAISTLAIRECNPCPFPYSLVTTLT